MKAFKDFENDLGDGSDKVEYLAYLRVELSAMAMRGLIANPNLYASLNGFSENREPISRVSIEIADALIKQLKI